MTKPSLVGERLIRIEVVDAAGLKRALEVQSKDGITLGKALSDLGLTNENTVATAIAQGLQLECLRAELEVAPELASLPPMKFCRKHFVAPSSSAKGRLLAGVQ